MNDEQHEKSKEDLIKLLYVELDMINNRLEFLPVGSKFANDYERRQLEKERSRIQDRLDWLEGRAAAEEIKNRNSFISPKDAQEAEIRFAGSAEAREVVANALNDPPKPNKALRKLAKKYKDSIG